jgi:hypothetical protein
MTVRLCHDLRAGSIEVHGGIKRPSLAMEMGDIARRPQFQRVHYRRLAMSVLRQNEYALWRNF